MDRGSIRGLLQGRTQVMVDGRLVDAWPRPAARRVVTLLLLAPDHVLTRDAVAEQLFSHLEPTRAARALSKAISQARSVLDTDRDDRSVIQADLGAVWIDRNRDVTVDVIEHLARLDAALQDADSQAGRDRLRAELANCGPVLVDDSYEDWAIATLAEVDRRRREARLAVARSSQDLSDWEAVAAHDPANEEACAALVDGHLAAGRRQEAARVFATCREALRELGVAPAPALAARVAASTAPAGDSLWPLFGRDPDLSAVCAAAATAQHGHGQVVLLTAAAGMGKTHLVQHAMAEFRQRGWLVTFGTSAAQDRLVPFAALRSALEEEAATASPLISRVLRPAPASTERPLEPAEVAAIADALRRHLDQLSATAPLLLCLDDLQWADQAMQAVVQRLSAVAFERRWSLLLAARTDEPGAPVPDLPSSVVHLPLAPLDDHASVQLAEHTLSTLGTNDPERAREIARRGQGHPFFIVELARSDDPQPEPGEDHRVVPERIVELLRRRVAVCSPAARRLTALIAVAGDDASAPLAVALSERLLDPGQDLGDVLDELTRSHLVRADGDRLQLVHPLLRDAAESTINPVRRAQLHDDVAAALLRNAPEARGRVMLSVARHRLGAFAATGTAAYAALAAPAAFEAGAISRGLGAADAAAQLFEGGLAAFEQVEAPRRSALRSLAFEAWVGLGQVRVDTGEYVSAQEAFDAALGLAADADERAVAWRWLSHVHYRRGDLPAAIKVLDAAIPSIPEGSSLGRARLLVELGWARYRDGQTRAGLRELDRAVQHAEDADDPVLLAQCLDRYAFVLAQMEPPEESLPLFERALQAVVRGDDSQEEAIVRMHTSVPLYLSGRHDEAAAALDHAAALCDRHGHLYTRSTVHWGRAMVEADRGRVAAALAERDAERVLLEALGNDRNLAVCHTHRAELLRRLGRDAEADEAANEARQAASRSGVGNVTAAGADAAASGNSVGTRDG